MTLQEYKNEVRALIEKERPGVDISVLFVPEYDQHYQNGLKKGAPAAEMAFAIIMLYEMSGGKLAKPQKKEYTLESYKAEVAQHLNELEPGKDFFKYLGDDRQAFFEAAIRCETTPKKTAESIISMAKWDSMFG